MFEIFFVNHSKEGGFYHQTAAHTWDQQFSSTPEIAIEERLAVINMQIALQDTETGEKALMVIPYEELQSLAAHAKASLEICKAIDLREMSDAVRRQVAKEKHSNG